MQDKKTKRITFIVDGEWHKDIKKRAAECGVTMQRWIEKALEREKKRGWEMSKMMPLNRMLHEGPPACHCLPADQSKIERELRRSLDLHSQQNELILKQQKYANLLEKHRDMFKKAFFAMTFLAAISNIFFIIIFLIIKDSQ